MKKRGDYQRFLSFKPILYRTYLRTFLKVFLLEWLPGKIGKAGILSKLKFIFRKTDKLNYIET